MPEMNFTIRWPDGTQVECYSPSYIIEEYLGVGKSYPVADFLARAGEALEIASERVRQRYGFACSSALDQLAQLREQGERWVNPPAAEPVRVEVVGFLKHPPRDARASSK